MYYVSTRDKSLRYSPAQAIAQGLSRDGGLFLPVTTPKLPADALKKMVEMTYQQRAQYIMGMYLETSPLRSWASMRKRPMARINSTQLTWPLCARWMTIPIAWSCGMALPAHLRIWPCRCCLTC